MDPTKPSQLEAALRGPDPALALERLAEALAERGDPRGQLEALLLRARWDLGLPLVRPTPLNDLAEPTRTQYEERYVTALREVGRRLLDSGAIIAAWPYFRAIGEPEPVASAIEAFQPEALGEDEDDGGFEVAERINEVIDVALGQGVHPRRGFDLVLDHHGTCSALTAFDSLPADEAIRRHAAGRLAHRLHRDLISNLDAELARHGEPAPEPGTPLPHRFDGRPWLFDDDSYHVDTSHLAMVVRLAPLLDDPAAIRLARDLCDYGARLSPRLRPDGEPPFDDHFGDHTLYLGALLDPEGAGEAAVAHFRSKLGPPGAFDPSDRETPVRAQTLVRLLDRLGRPGEAFDVASSYLADLPDGALGEPSLASLGLRLGRLDDLARLATLAQDPVRLAAVRLEQARQPR